VQDCCEQCASIQFHINNTLTPPQVSGLSDPNPDRSLLSLKILTQYRTRDDMDLEVQAAARDPTCIPALLHTALGARHQLASITDPERSTEQRDKLRCGLLLLQHLLSLYASLRPLVGAAIAAAPPATLDASGEWMTQPGPTQPGPLEAEVELNTVWFALRIAYWAASCSLSAAAALARRPSVVRALVTAMAHLSSPDNRHIGVSFPLVVSTGLTMFDAMLKASREDVMRALAAGRPGGGRDGNDLVQRLRGLVEAAVAGVGLQAEVLESAEAVLAALAEGEEWLNLQVDQ